MNDILSDLIIVYLWNITFMCLIQERIYKHMYEYNNFFKNSESLFAIASCHGIKQSCDYVINNHFRVKVKTRRSICISFSCSDLFFPVSVNDLITF